MANPTGIIVIVTHLAPDHARLEVSYWSDSRRSATVEFSDERIVSWTFGDDNLVRRASDISDDLVEVAWGAIQAARAL